MACNFGDLTSVFMRPQERLIKGYRFASVKCPGVTHLKWENVSPKRFKKSTLVQAVAIPVAPSPEDSSFVFTSENYRKQLCESYGFRQIGEPLPDSVTLKDIVATLPKEVFEIDDVKAWKSVLTSVASYSLGLFLISKAPWFLLPLAWAWTGTAITGFFVIGHDCAHKSFSKNKLVEDIIGTLAFLPLIYPYEPWRFKHDQHHAKTNMLLADTAWHPVRKEVFEKSPIWRKAIIYGYGPFRPLMSITHWLIWHFDTKKFRPNEVKRVTISLACVFAYMAIGWPLIVYKIGVMGWIKFWLIPWLGYHFWMSTFTMVHHTAPHIPFKDSKEWNAAQAQLSGTVHCDYPSWVVQASIANYGSQIRLLEIASLETGERLRKSYPPRLCNVGAFSTGLPIFVSKMLKLYLIEFLCHDINVHIPHHISSRIPSYNLRAAHQSLCDNWGKYMNEATWNWRLMKTIMTICHVYCEERNYVPFDELAPKESYPITFLKKIMPDSA